MRRASASSRGRRRAPRRGARRERLRGGLGDGDASASPVRLSDDLSGSSDSEFAYRAYAYASLEPPRGASDAGTARAAGPAPGGRPWDGADVPSTARGTRSVRTRGRGTAARVPRRGSAGGRRAPRRARASVHAAETHSGGAESGGSGESGEIVTFSDLFGGARWRRARRAGAGGGGRRRADPWRRAARRSPASVPTAADAAALVARHASGPCRYARWARARASPSPRPAPRRGDREAGAAARGGARGEPPQARAPAVARPLFALPSRTPRLAEGELRARGRRGRGLGPPLRGRRGDRAPSRGGTARAARRVDVAVRRRGDDEGRASTAGRWTEATFAADGARRRRGEVDEVAASRFALGVTDEDRSQRPPSAPETLGEAASRLPFSETLNATLLEATRLASSRTKAAPPRGGGGRRRRDDAVARGEPWRMRAPRRAAAEIAAARAVLGARLGRASRCRTARLSRAHAAASSSLARLRVYRPVGAAGRRARIPRFEERARCSTRPRARPASSIERFINPILFNALSTYLCSLVRRTTRAAAEKVRALRLGAVPRDAEAAEELA